jgi:hypothetical protein
MRVPIPVPTSVILCDHKLGFGLVGSYIEKFKIFQTPLCLGSPDSPVCTGHCTVQCLVHRQPRAINPFSCALSGGSPDSYCALSGVHRTCTVDCPVRPYRVLKKDLQPDRARGSLFSFSASVFSATSDSYSPAGDLRPPAATVSVCAPATSGPSPSLLGELPCSPPSRFCEQRLPFPPRLHQFQILQILVKSNESSWWNVFNCPHYVSLQVLGSFGRVFPRQIAVSP